MTEARICAEHIQGGPSRCVVAMGIMLEAGGSSAERCSGILRVGSAYLNRYSLHWRRRYGMISFLSPPPFNADYMRFWYVPRHFVLLWCFFVRADLSKLFVSSQLSFLNFYSSSTPSPKQTYSDLLNFSTQRWRIHQSSIHMKAPPNISIMIKPQWASSSLHC